MVDLAGHRPASAWAESSGAASRAEHVATLAVIGCGNPNRQDDGAGPAVIARLRQIPLPGGVLLCDCGTDGMGVLYRARGADALIVVDARVPEAAPGAIYEVPGGELALPPPASLTLHDFRWDHALYAGRRIAGADFPDDVRVILIEAAAIGFGLDLSPAAAAAVERVASRIAEQAASFAAARVAIADGSATIPAGLAQAHFGDALAVAALRQDRFLHLMPVAGAAAGGRLLKRRNARGDRLVHVPEFTEGLRGSFASRWDATRSALSIRLLTAN